MGFSGGENVDMVERFAQIVEDTFDIESSYPKDVEVSAACKALLRSLLTRDPDKRLSQPAAIKNHAFLGNIQFALIRSTTPPHVPELSGAADTRYFATKFTSEQLSAEWGEEDGEDPLDVYRDGEDGMQRRQGDHDGAGVVSEEGVELDVDINIEGGMNNPF